MARTFGISDQLPWIERAAFGTSALPSDGPADMSIQSALAMKSEAEAHILARAAVEALKAAGYQFDRKQMRFNDIVAEAMNAEEFDFAHDFYTGLADALSARCIAYPVDGEITRPHPDFSPHGARYPGFEWTGHFDSAGFAHAFRQVA